MTISTVQVITISKPAVTKINYAEKNNNYSIMKLATIRSYIANRYL